ncbi:MAG TPA: ethanolamine ammonia-lyase subunit EutB, partial [Pirellulales bacterium]|nr:ethanolamine ammonia-lyase subunit EutB [Pirellulales bacterium]
MTRQLKPLEDIAVPPVAPEETYVRRLFDRDFKFVGLKTLLAAADFSKAGDRHAGLAARDEREREAARTILASLSLEHLYAHPLSDDQGIVDEVMRVNYDVDHEILSSIATLTVGEFKNRLLCSDAAVIAPLGRALTGPMAAAVAKLCDVHELVLLAQKMPRTSRARTTLGLPGTLASRVQPNHPTDDLRGITLLVFWGLSLGAGDALIGLNPATDTVENVETILCHL